MPEELVIPKLRDRDIERLISALDDNNMLGHLKGRPLSAQIAEFRDKNKANRELVVAMHEATTGLRFRERVITELDQLEQPAKAIYAVTAVASSRRFNLTKDEIILAISDTSNEAINEIKRLLTRRLLIHPNNNEHLYTCRHRVISDFVHSAIHTQGMMYPILSGILRMAASKSPPHSARSSRHNRMITKFINHDFIYRMLEVDQAKTLYADLEDLLDFSHHFWLHRGSLEVEYGSLEYAENYLAQALGLADSDPLVRNEWAYLLF